MIISRLIFFCFLLLIATFSWSGNPEVASKVASTEGSKVLNAGESAVNVFVSLILVVLVIFFLAWAMRRMGGGGFRNNSVLKIIGGVSMGSRERIVLVQVGEQQLLLGVAPGRVQTLHVLEESVEINSAVDNIPGAFSDKLKSLLNKDAEK